MQRSSSLNGMDLAKCGIADHEIFDLAPKGNPPGPFPTYTRRAESGSARRSSGGSRRLTKGGLDPSHVGESGLATTVYAKANTRASKPPIHSSDLGLLHDTKAFLIRNFEMKDMVQHRKAPSFVIPWPIGIARALPALYKIPARPGKRWQQQKGRGPCSCCARPLLSQWGTADPLSS
ncbi:hypothetical protein Salat_0645000 [Sesamum alatum]|uniref:Uncharacterized protein n=1 Tax=Sesamum alatum TaxID=300844 RepID=A0AAE1YRT5_9LAMI|nr:hypothetical protein Salat_0645000 [Sesamum alatum]